MKPLRTLLLLLAACFLLAGCAGAAASGTDSGFDAASASQPSASSSAAASSVPENAGQRQSFEGILLDTSMNQMHVELEDGSVVAFGYMDADTAELYDTLPGARVVVQYTGAFNGENDDGMQVVAVSNPPSLSLEEYAAQYESFTGRVTGHTKTQVTVQADSGEAVTFGSLHADTSHLSRLEEGAAVTVYYEPPAPSDAETDAVAIADAP